jgi:PQQ-like domain
MFHVKHRLTYLLLAALLLASVATACGRATPTRGWAAPLVIGDRELVSSGRGRIDAVDSQARLHIWRFPKDWTIPEKKAQKLSGIYGTPIPSQDGRVVFVGDYNGYVYAFRPADLDAPSSEKPKAASLKLEGHIIGGMVLDTATDTLYATAGERLYSIRASDLAGRIDNRDAPVTHAELFKAEKEIWSAPVLSGCRVFFASLDGNLYAVDARTGAEVWRFTSDRALVATPAMAGTSLLVGGFADRLYSIDASSGNQKWSFSASNWVWSRPTIDGNRAYFGDFDGNLFAVDLGSGDQTWRLALNKGAIRGSPALVNGTLVVGTEDGWLVGIDASSQATRWEKKLSTSFNSDLVAQGSNVFITPGGCVKPEGSDSKTYYIAVDAQTGDLKSAEGIC